MLTRNFRFVYNRGVSGKSVAGGASLLRKEVVAMSVVFLDMLERILIDAAALATIVELVLGLVKGRGHESRTDDEGEK